MRRDTDDLFTTPVVYCVRPRAIAPIEEEAAALQIICGDSLGRCFAYAQFWR